jgi:hypothetical protein
MNKLENQHDTTNSDRTLARTTENDGASGWSGWDGGAARSGSGQVLWSGSANDAHRNLTNLTGASRTTDVAGEDGRANTGADARNRANQRVYSEYTRIQAAEVSSPVA